MSTESFYKDSFEIVNRENKYLKLKLDSVEKENRE